MKRILSFSSSIPNKYKGTKWPLQTLELYWILDGMAEDHSIILLDISNVQQVPGWQFSGGARLMFAVEVAGADCP